MDVAQVPTFCDMLVHEGYLTEDQVYEAVMTQVEKGGHLLESLIDLGHIHLDEFHAIMARTTDVAILDLNQCMIQEDTVAVLPESVASKHHVFPIDKLGPLLTLGMAIPTDLEAISEVEQVTGLRVKPGYCKPSDINAKVREHYAVEEAVDSENLKEVANA